MQALQLVKADRIRVVGLDSAELPDVFEQPPAALPPMRNDIGHTVPLVPGPYVQDTTSPCMEGGGQAVGGRSLLDPNRTWKSVSMDLITQMLFPCRGHAEIVDFVDSLPKMVPLTP